MVRSIPKSFALFVVFWVCLAASGPSAAGQPVDISGDGAIRIGDLGLADQVPSAIDLIGPEEGVAGRNRAALVHGLECWIDGIESCSFEHRNDPRVRAIRRFLTTGPSDRDGSVVIHFPDRTRIEVRVARVADPGPDDWDRRVYEAVVLPDSIQVPGRPGIPSRPDEFEELAYDGQPAIRAALERLAGRLQSATRKFRFR